MRTLEHSRSSCIAKVTATMILRLSSRKSMTRVARSRRTKPRLLRGMADPRRNCMRREKRALQIFLADQREPCALPSNLDQRTALAIVSTEDELEKSERSKKDTFVLLEEGFNPTFQPVHATSQIIVFRVCERDDTFSEWRSVHFYRCR